MSSALYEYHFINISPMYAIRPENLALLIFKRGIKHLDFFTVSLREAVHRAPISQISSLKNTLSLKSGGHGITSIYIKA